MLAAMMAGDGEAFANSVNLLTASPWVVPVGVTSLNVFAATAGGGLGVESSRGDFGGGGGGGALILNGVVSVTPGETLSVGTVGGAVVTYTVTGSVTGTLFIVSTGGTAGQSGVRTAGVGGTAQWVPTSQTALAGVLTNITGGGVMVGGGSGGTGGTSPSTPGTAGTASGGSVYPAIAAGADYGGGGGGYFPGDAYLTASMQTNTRGTTFLRVRY